MTENLKSMVDRHGLHTVLTVLAEICQDKGVLTIEAWQDYELAKAWELVSIKLDKLSNNRTVRGLW